MGDDLTHAIQAAAEALWMARAKDGEGEADWKVEMDHYAARIAVEAAAPHLHADLQQQLDELIEAAQAFLHATTATVDRVSWGEYHDREYRLASLVGYDVDGLSAPAERPEVTDD